MGSGRQALGLWTLGAGEDCCSYGRVRVVLPTAHCVMLSGGSCTDNAVGWRVTNARTVCAIAWCARRVQAFLVKFGLTMANVIFGGWPKVQNVLLLLQALFLLYLYLRWVSGNAQQLGFMAHHGAGSPVNN